MAIKILKVFTVILGGLMLVLVIKLTARSDSTVTTAPKIKEHLCIENDEMNHQELYVEIQRLEVIEDKIDKKIRFRERRKQKK